MIDYLVRRQQPDGTYPTVGTDNQAIFYGYRTRRGAMRYAIIPYLNGKPGIVEVYRHENRYGEPVNIFQVNEHGQQH